MKLTIIVICYNKKSIFNETTKSLSLQNGFFKNIDVVIFNNGPHYFHSNDDAISTLLKLRHIYGSVNIVENPNNNPLSHIYNDFIDEHSSDYYCILDDDTNLTLSYLSSLSKKISFYPDADVFIPIILSAHNNTIYYPLIDGVPYDKEYINFKDGLRDKTVFSVGSGMIFSENICKKIRETGKFPFDENFALYGVDFSFFRNIHKLKQQGNIIDIILVEPLYHDMSGVLDEMPQWRLVEREYDKILSIKHYSSNQIFALVKFFHLMISHFLRLNISLAILSFKVFVAGKHPRCFQRVKNLFITSKKN